MDWKKLKSSLFVAIFFGAYVAFSSLISSVVFNYFKQDAFIAYTASLTASILTVAVFLIFALYFSGINPESLKLNVRSLKLNRSTVALAFIIGSLAMLLRYSFILLSVKAGFNSSADVLLWLFFLVLRECFFILNTMAFAFVAFKLLSRAWSPPSSAMLCAFTYGFAGAFAEQLLTWLGLSSTGILEVFGTSFAVMFAIIISYAVSRNKWAPLAFTFGYVFTDYTIFKFLSFGQVSPGVRALDAAVVMLSFAVAALMLQALLKKEEASKTRKKR